MAQRFYKIIVVSGLLCTSLFARAQQYSTKGILEIHQRSPLSIHNVVLIENKFSAVRRPTLPFISLPCMNTNPPFKQNSYNEHLAFFCRKQWEFEKATRIPLRIRMGSLQQCNFLEGKKR